MRIGLAVMVLSSAAGAAYAEPPSLKAALASIRQCERPAPEDIVVCGRSREDGRFRLPPDADPVTGDPADTSVARERNGLIERTADGIGSCSPVGAGGESGCLKHEMHRAYEQRHARPKAR